MLISEPYWRAWLAGHKKRGQAMAGAAAINMDAVRFHLQARGVPAEEWEMYEGVIDVLEEEVSEHLQRKAEKREQENKRKAQSAQGQAGRRSPGAVARAGLRKRR